jgi:hypothetical protein
MNASNTKVAKGITTIFPSAFRMSVTPNKNIVLDLCDIINDVPTVVGSFIFEPQMAKSIIDALSQAAENSTTSIEKK